ncbi:MAG: methylated-DNA--[protein]-cysteine S-methyltransferase [Anaerolineaceae bacterium]
MGQTFITNTWNDFILVDSTFYSVNLIFNQFGLKTLDMQLRTDQENPKGPPPVGFMHVHQWLLDYFNGTCQAVDFPIDWSQFTPFQRRALEAVAAIPYGEVLSYKDVAIKINQPAAVRAVAHANATNPIPIVIPCHRVIGSDRRLHGYSGPGGLSFKEYLLRLEGLSIDHQRVV